MSGDVDREVRRTELLQQLLAGSGDLEELGRGLAAFEWDSERELVTLDVAHAQSVLRSFVAGSVSEPFVHRWAELIECRDDIGLEPDRRELLLRLVFELATPEIMEPLTIEVAERWLRRLSER